jgi:dihydroflavonol-4-reductase
MKPALVTGATGFLGRHLVEQLLSRGEQVRILSRGPATFTKDVEVLRGDITEAADVDKAVKGASRVYHCAGMVSRKPEDAPQLERVHVHGTRLVCEAAKRHKLDRVVYVSTSGTIAVSRKPVDHTEESGYKDALVARWAYYVTKIAAEKVALEFDQVVSINPALLLGPGDERRSSTGDIAAMLEGQILSLPTGGLCFVDARDCAAAAIAAMEKGRPKQRYLLGAANWDFRQLAKAVSTIAGVSTPFFSSPAWMSLLAAPALRKIMPILGRKFDIDDVTIEMAGMFWYCDSTKARKELGFSPRDPMQTLRDTIADLRKPA